jgi:hypothetical protein
MKLLHPDKVDPILIRDLTNVEKMVLAAYPRAESVVTADWSDGVGHVADSQHYPQSDGLCRAVDFYFQGAPPAFVWIVLSRFPAIRGLGWYPDRDHPGFHADRREAPMRALWTRRGAESYIAFDPAMMALLLAKS